MNSRTNLSLGLALVSLAALSMLPGNHNAAADSALPSTQAIAPPIVVPSPDYTVNPANTDGHPADDQTGEQPDCPGSGIGCFDQWGDSATNDPHLFYLPPNNSSGKLLVFFNGGSGKPNPDLPIYSFAASLGYHVIGLSYFTAGDGARINACDNDPEQQSCYEDFMREVLFGSDNCEHEKCSGLNIDDHPQDAALNRLVKALEWARDNKSNVWGHYLTTDGEVDWAQVNIAGYSNGSSYASLMGILFPSVGRVTLFSGPNDGKGNSEDQWKPADHIQFVAGLTETKYYGLVHTLNKADDEGATSTLYRVKKAWLEFGMSEPFNSSPLYFVPSEVPKFGTKHMLISTNPTTNYVEAHGSVVHGRECSKEGFDEDGKWDCLEWEGDWLGYDAAWRCVLGIGNPNLNTTPTADAGANQTLECEGGGGATVKLDGSDSTDPECDLLSYTWTGPFGVVTGRKPTLFLPVGTSLVTLVVSDGLASSTADTTSITVVDTQPPSLSVTLTPIVLWQPNHVLIRINATVSFSDSCGGPPPTVVLTSITSNQPDNGLGDGDTNGDIQEADFETFDRSFLLRAERAGGDPLGRIYTVTYTATDASGNKTRKSATVHVPH